MTVKTTATCEAVRESDLAEEATDTLAKLAQGYWDRMDDRLPQAGDLKAIVRRIEADVRREAEAHGLEHVIKIAALTIARHA